MRGHGVQGRNRVSSIPGDRREGAPKYEAGSRILHVGRNLAARGCDEPCSRKAEEIYEVQAMVVVLVSS